MAESALLRARASPPLPRVGAHTPCVNPPTRGRVQQFVQRPPGVGKAVQQFVQRPPGVGKAVQHFVQRPPGVEKAVQQFVQRPPGVGGCGVVFT